MLGSSGPSPITVRLLHRYQRQTFPPLTMPAEGRSTQLFAQDDDMKTRFAAKQRGLSGPLGPQTKQIMKRTGALFGRGCAWPTQATSSLISRTTAILKRPRPNPQRKSSHDQTVTIPGAPAQSAAESHEDGPSVHSRQDAAMGENGSSGH